MEDYFLLELVNGGSKSVKSYHVLGLARNDLRTAIGGGQAEAGTIYEVIRGHLNPIEHMKGK